MLAWARLISAFSDRTRFVEQDHRTDRAIGTIGGPIALTGLDTITALGNFTTSGEVSFVDQIGFVVGGTVTASGITLTTPGAITETGALATGTLNGSPRTWL